MKKLPALLLGIFTILGDLSSQEYQMIIDPRGHNGKVHELLFTPDNLLISLSEDKTIQVWDLQSERMIDKFFAPMDYGPEGMIYSAALDQKGRTLAYSGYIQEDSVFAVVVMDLTTKKESILLQGHDQPISALSFSQDDQWMASGSLDGSVVLWKKTNQNTFVKRSTIQVEGGINDLGFAFHKNLLAIASQSKFLTLIDLQNQNVPIRIEKHYYPISSVAFSPDSSNLITGGMDGYIHQFTANGKHIRKLDRLDNPISSISCSPDGQSVIALSEGSGLGKTYSLKDGSVIASFREHDNTVTASAFSQKTVLGSYLAASAGGNNNQILIWNPLSGRLSNILNGHGAAIWNIDFSDSTTLLLRSNAESKRYNYAFNFSAQHLEIIDQAVPEESKPELSAKFSLRLPQGVIKNDPSRDGRMLCSKTLSDGSILIGSDFSLKKYSSKGKLITEYKGHIAGVRDIAIAPNQKMFFSGGEDQKILGWEMEAADSRVEPTISLFVTKNGEWVMWSRNGYYSSSPQGAKYLGWKTQKGFDAETSFFTVDQYFEVLFRPTAFLRSFQTGKSVEFILEEKGERKFDLSSLNKPSLAFFGRPYVSNLEGKSFYLNRKSSSQTYLSEISPVTFETTLFDRGGGIKEFKVYHNDKLAKIEKDISDQNEQRIEKEFSLPLLSGQNKIEIVATNFQNVDSKPHRLDIEYTGETSATSNLYVFTIGINSYKNPSYNLNYAYDDARSFTEKISSSSKGIYSDVFLTEIYNEDATLENIQKKIAEVQSSANLQDVFIFYYAGHGTIDDANNNDYYLVPSNVTQIYGDSKQLQERAISAGMLKEWFASIRAQKQLILLDACHSGEAVQTFASRASAPEEKAIVQLARSSGTVLISASGSKQFATEFAALKHGAFTYALLEALDGLADGGDKDQKITVNEIKAYMEDRVPELTKEYGGGNPQYPTGFSTGQDFPIKVIEK